MVKNYFTYINETIIRSFDQILPESFTIMDINNILSSDEKSNEYLKSFLLGKIVHIKEIFPRSYPRGYYQGSGPVDVLVFDVIKESGCNHAFVDENGIKYEPIYTSIITYIRSTEDNEKIMKKLEEIKKRKEEKRLMMMDIDPYGEDDWE